MTYEECFESLSQMRQQIEEVVHCEEELELALRAMSRQTPKKPDLRQEQENFIDVFGSVSTMEADVFVCPQCDSLLCYKGEQTEDNFCPNCGQAIDWSEQE